jgi:beta-aspartyl-peptidase (threonine type)
MKRLLTLLLILPLLAACATEDMPATPAAEPAVGKTAIVIHGGAGTILKANMDDETEAAYRAKLEEALRAGHDVLSAGGAALDAVIAAIHVMEESELFNAGRGAVFTSEGTNELDASIMDGATRNSGAVAGVKRVKSPIALARVVMEKSPHVMMAGAGAETYAEANGLEMVDNSYFYTERRYRALQRALEREAEATSSVPFDRSIPMDLPLSPNGDKFGTVGAVALDVNGNIVAGTSTGGMNNKKFGRIGDAPIIGAGTYADNRTAGISATGHGEYFIRGVVAHDIASRMDYLGEDLVTAADAVVMDKLTELGGTGGIVALDRTGAIAMPFNTEGMYRGYIDVDGNLEILIYGPGDE